MRQNNYRITKIFPNTYRIEDNGPSINCYFIYGEKSGMLIDAGTARGDLKKVVDNLADGKPYIVALTHGHVDHIAGAYQYKDVYISESDKDLFVDFLFLELHFAPFYFLFK